MQKNTKEKNLRGKAQMELLIMFKEDKGLGDTVERFAKATGIKSVVDKVSQGLNIPCGCEGRKEALNKVFQYKKR